MDKKQYHVNLQFVTPLILKFRNESNFEFLMFKLLWRILRETLKQSITTK